MIPRIFLLPLLALTLASCTGSGTAAPVASADPNAPKRSFKTDVSPMIASRCAPCHMAGRTSPALFGADGTPSAALLAKEGNRSLTEIRAGRMPRNAPGSVTAAETAALSEWVAQGAADN